MLNQRLKLTKLDRLAAGVLLACGLAVIAMLLLDRAIGVRVLRTDPADGQAIGATARIGVQFGEAMQRETVEERFRMSPQTPGRYEWSGDQLWFVPDQPLQTGRRYRAELSSGASARSGRSLQAAQSWEFEVRRAGIAYLAPASGPRELWLDDLQGELRSLTETGGMVFDFAVSHDGEWIAYSVVNELGGVDLWLSPTRTSGARLLVDCGSDRCSVPDWSPNGQRLAYSREELAGDGPLGPPRLWTVQVSSAQTAAVYQDSQILGHGPSWSPDGSRLAFFDGNLGAIRVLQVDSGAEQLLPSRMGVVGGWSPSSRQMLFNVMLFRGETAAAGLQLADFTLQSTAPLELPDAPARDFGVPAWSADGERVLIGLQTIEGGPGRQLWLMRPDGAEAVPLVSDAAFTHGGYHWSPDGGQIVYQRFPLRVANAVPELFVLDLQSGEPRLLASDASSPAWVP